MREVAGVSVPTPKVMPSLQTTDAPGQRSELPTSFMMQAMRDGLGPTQVDERAYKAGHRRSDAFWRHILIVRGYDNLIGGGFVTRTDVYLSAPRESREAVAATLKELGHYWTPGRRSGLFATLRRELEVPTMDVEVCVRYGPFESLYGDLFANLRRYELLLWGYLVGVLRREFAEEDADWRRTGWWRRGVPEAERRQLTAEWSVRDDMSWPWQLATFGTMQKIVDKHASHFAKASGEGDPRALGVEVRHVADIRNAVMHPLGGKELTEDDFASVTEALQNLVRMAHRARARGAIEESSLPAAAELMLPELLRERLYPEADQP